MAKADLETGATTGARFATSPFEQSHRRRCSSLASIPFIIDPLPPLLICTWYQVCSSISTASFPCQTWCDAPVLFSLGRKLSPLSLAIMSGPRLIFAILAILISLLSTHRNLIVAQEMNARISFSPLFQLPFSLSSGTEPAAPTHQANGVSWHAGKVHLPSPSQFSRVMQAAHHNAQPVPSAPSPSVSAFTLSSPEAKAAMNTALTALPVLKAAQVENSFWVDAAEGVNGALDKIGSALSLLDKSASLDTSSDSAALNDVALLTQRIENHVQRVANELGYGLTGSDADARLEGHLQRSGLNMMDAQTCAWWLQESEAALLQYELMKQLTDSILPQVAVLFAGEQVAQSVADLLKRELDFTSTAFLTPWVAQQVAKKCSALHVQLIYIIERITYIRKTVGAP